MKTNKGISLIVLVITIIVMIILAGAIILSLSNNGIIDKASEAVSKTNLSQVQTLAQLKWSEAYLAGKRSVPELTAAIINDLNKELGEEEMKKYKFTITTQGVTVDIVTEEEADINEVRTLALIKWSEAYLAGDMTEAELEQAVLDALEEELGADELAKYDFDITFEGVIVESVLPEEDTSIPENATEITGKDGNFKYVVLANGDIQITRYTGDDTEVTIPAKYDGYDVYAIGNVSATTTKESRYNIFGKDKNETTNSSITKVVISDGIKEIRLGAFSLCTKLEQVVFSNTLQIVGMLAFSECSGMTGDLILPNSVSVIDTAAFRLCTGLNGNLILPKSLKTIGAQAFDRCSGLKGKLEIPDRVTTIGNTAFYACTGLTSLELSSKLETIGSHVFNACTNLTGSLVLPNTLTTIGKYAFYQCTGLTGNLTIPNSVTTIDEYAFYQCTGFNGTLTLLNSLQTIGNYAFAECTGFIGNIVIPNSVTTIGKYAFYRCSGFNGNLTLSNNLTSLGEWAFRECTNLTGGITIPTTLTILNPKTFLGCSSLDGELVLHDGITYISDMTFADCSNLTGTIDVTGITLGVDTFLRCNKLNIIQ